MTYHYEIGAVRWHRQTSPGDVRGYRPNKGWDAEAMLIDQHPISGRQLATSQWWFREVYTGDDE